MSKPPRKYRKKPDYMVATPEKDETEQDETEDIYDSEQRERMLDEDEMTAAEEGFMRGRDEPPEKKATRKKAVSHDDSVSVELAKEDSEDD
jgi:hypothetical protein